LEFGISFLSLGMTIIMCHEADFINRQLTTSGEYGIISGTRQCHPQGTGKQPTTFA